jgi:putative nucleotidyltransferase with HDIG domain
MIPTDIQARALWDTYALPQAKRIHSSLVADVSLFLAKALVAKGIRLNGDLLLVSALLHDIDKNVPQSPGKHHPDAAVRILRESGYEEVARVVETHPLHAILDPIIVPKEWEEKLLYLADKMVKHEVVGVDGRFALWRNEQLPPQALAQLDAAYPKVKELEKEIAQTIGVPAGEMTNYVTKGILSST